jgi:hypothetical protein
MAIRRPVLVLITEYLLIGRLEKSPPTVVHFAGAVVKAVGRRDSFSNFMSNKNFKHAELCGQIERRGV